MDSIENTSISLADLIAAHRTALTVPDLAKILSLSNKQIYSLIKRGILSAIRIASSVRLDPSAIAIWLRSQTA